jgi:hypothetical protein
MPKKDTSPKEQPNRANVTLVPTMPPTAGSWSSEGATEEVIGFQRCRVDAGALVFEYPDGSLVAYGPGRWQSVVTSYDEGLA